MKAIKMVTLFVVLAVCAYANVAGAAGKDDIPIDAAMRVGMGKNVVIEFDDPDCPFCRKLNTYLNTRKDITRYIFFVPLKNLHPLAEAKVRSILCSKNPWKTLEETFAGKHDSDTPPACTSKSVTETINIHQSIATRLGVESTPFLIVNGQPVHGADINLIESIIGPAMR
ncbi:thioredoxin fold domain-containing protein [Candidatus Magnetomonas plexicatena]|uniref:thioredoxin fold domain-containing protein n=1 Tax=Candidatus Magnetomonas plexicatena TaxID=2552947 RepID=UPI001C771BD9|nr:thioredoxin fold domain-containing protein [Nitrospirales bacterium LBB_01]